MNREIKFRGKRVNGGEWVYGMTISNGTIKRKINNIFFEVAENKWVGVLPETLGQYTGLKDKDGREIYEGDILQYIGKRRDNMNKVYRRKVVFHEGMFALLSKELPVYSALNYHCMEDGRSAWSVIGNIHDNPNYQASV